MTIRQTTRGLLRRAQAEAAHALAGIATKYGLNVKAIPEATSAYESTMKVVVAVPTYNEPATRKDGRKIVLIAKTNPHRKGSKTARTFELMKRSATVAEFRARAQRAQGMVYPSYVAWASKPHGGKPALIRLK